LEEKINVNTNISFIFHFEYKKPSTLICTTIVFFAPFKIINKKLANSK
jgi:hypothetical protein